MKIGEILPFYHSKLWNDSLLLKSLYLGDGEFLYVLSCYVLLQGFFFFKKLSVCETSTNKCVSCLSYKYVGVEFHLNRMGLFFPTPWQGWTNLDLGMNASKKIALQILYWRVSPLNSFDGRKVQKGAELTENCRCAGGSKNGTAKGNQSGNCCALTWSE